MLVTKPPDLAHALKWRRLYCAGRFIQRELLSSGSFRSAASERGTQLGIGDATLAYLHEVGAMRPVAFSRGQYWIGGLSPAEPAERLVFSDEDQSTSWDDFAFDLHGSAEVVALYSPWQQLAAIDAVDAGTFTVPLWVVAADKTTGARAVDDLREWAQGQDSLWRSLDEAWRPLVLLLVRLQNRYWPEITRRTTLLLDPEGGHVDPSVSERQTFDAKRVFETELAEDRDGLLATYEFLVERGLDHDPCDGLAMLRRARPRAFHIRWRGAARRAQDHFDAAELIRRFLVDLDGRNVPQPSAVPLDFQQRERAELYRRGPAAAWTAAEVITALQEAELYPHGVHVIHEGLSERVVIEALVATLLDPSVLEEMSFTDLEGAGNAGIVAELVGSLDGYTRRVVVVLDSEAKAREHVEGLLASGKMSPEDVLLFDTSLEEANVSDDELVQVVRDLAAKAGYALDVDGRGLRAFHEERRLRALKSRQEISGLVTSFQQLVGRTAKGRWKLRKRDVARQVALLLAQEAVTTHRKDWERPITVFVAERIFPPLNRPVPV